MERSREPLELTIDNVKMCISLFNLDSIVAKLLSSSYPKTPGLEVHSTSIGVVLLIAKEIPEYKDLDLNEWMKVNLGIHLNQNQLIAIDKITDKLLEDDEELFETIISCIQNPSKYIEDKLKEKLKINKSPEKQVSLSLLMLKALDQLIERNWPALVSGKLGLLLRDFIWQIETRDPSPIRKRDGWKRKRDRERAIELIPIDKFLGEYLPQDQQIKLYLEEIEVSAQKLGVKADALRRVVEIHEAAHAAVHLGRDADGRYWSASDFQMADSGRDPSPLHETLAQLLCWHCVKHDPILLDCFLKLSERQLPEYKHWDRFRDIPLERIRNILVGMRQGKIEASFGMLDMLAH